MKKILYENAVAALNGYNNGISVYWMASMASVSQSTIYRRIRKGQNLILENHPQFHIFK